ncbi:MAG: hypothetical protein ACP5U1_01725 [Desulfomonilaceae bacterium]
MRIYVEVQEKRQEILRITASHGARNVRIFESVARGDAVSGKGLYWLLRTRILKEAKPL